MFSFEVLIFLYIRFVINKLCPFSFSFCYYERELLFIIIIIIEIVVMHLYEIQD